MKDLHPFGYAIKTIRIQKGFKQNELARRINVSPYSLSQIETGQTFPRLKTIESILKQLNVSFNLLLVMSIDPTKSRDPKKASEAISTLISISKK